MRPLPFPILIHLPSGRVSLATSACAARTHCVESPNTFISPNQCGCSIAGCSSRKLISFRPRSLPPSDEKRPYMKWQNLGAMTTGSIKIQLNETSSHFNRALKNFLYPALPQLQKNFGTLKSFILTLTRCLIISCLCFQMRQIATLQVMNQSNKSDVTWRSVDFEPLRRVAGHVLTLHFYTKQTCYCA